MEAVVNIGMKAVNHTGMKVIESVPKGMKKGRLDITELNR